MIMKTVCGQDKCVGCMACVEACPNNAIKVKMNMKFCNAIIDDKQCVKCNICHKICQVNNSPTTMEPIKWYQGWAQEAKIRLGGSSGGVASALSREIILEDGIVWSCVFEAGVFGFQKAETIEELDKFTGSKYVKSNPYGVYKSIRHELSEGKKVLFIGLPCQVAALKIYIGNELLEKLITVDLICHGTPSPEVLEKFLAQYNCQLSDLKGIKFRKKAHFKEYETEKDIKNYIGIVPNGVTDRYLIAFLNCLSFTNNCYSCNYAKIARVSDITLGDSWGSDLSEIEQKKGISLILCQSLKGIELVEKSEVYLENVNVENAILRNHQLREPAKRPKAREDFLERLEIGENFNKLVAEYYPKQCLKQELKKWLNKLKLIRSGKIIYSISVWKK